MVIFRLHGDFVTGKIMKYVGVYIGIPLILELPYQRKLAESLEI